MHRYGSNHHCIPLTPPPQSAFVSPTTELGPPTSPTLGPHLILALEGHLRLDVRTVRRKGAKKIDYIADKKRRLNTMGFAIEYG